MKIFSDRSYFINEGKAFLLKSNFIFIGVRFSLSSVSGINTSVLVPATPSNLGLFA